MPNFPHQMKPFDTKIDHLVYEIDANNIFLSLQLELGDISLSLLSNQKLKIIKINFYTKRKFKKFKRI
jgi:hypothetical protein